MLKPAKSMNKKKYAAQPQQNIKSKNGYNADLVSARRSSAHHYKLS
jgi:hypothetical protein